MAIRTSSWLARPLILRALYQHAKLAIRLWREPRVPALLKAIPFFALLYVVSPIDIVPDILPGLGQLDDLGVVLFALEFFIRLCPVTVQSFHRDAIAQRRSYSPMSSTDDVIEAEWRHG